MRMINLYQRYVNYCKKFNFVNDNRYLPNIKKFSDKLIKLEFGILKIKLSTTTVFRLCVSDVYKVMIKKKFIMNIREEENIKVFKEKTDNDSNEIY